MLYFLTEFGERGTISWSVLNWSRFAKYALCESERNEFFSKFLFCVLCCFVFVFAFLARDTMKRGQPEQKVRLTVLSPKAALWGGVGENIVLVNFSSSVTHSLMFLPCGVKPRMIFGFSWAWLAVCVNFQSISCCLELEVSYCWTRSRFWSHWDIFQSLLFPLLGDTQYFSKGMQSGEWNQLVFNSKWCVFLFKN